MLNFDPSLIGPDFNWQPSSVTLNVTGFGKIVNANPNRVMLIMSPGSGQYSFAPSVGGQPSAGFFVGGTIQFFLAKFADWGAIVGYEWWVNPAFAPVTFAIGEVIYQPVGGV